MRLPSAMALLGFMALPCAAEAMPLDALRATASGLLHPLRGPDHLLVMTAVGILAGQQDLVVRLSLPLSFLLSMAAGLTLAARGLAIPMVAPMILASVLVLGALLALAARPPAEGAAVVAALFGLCHGAAQGAAAQGQGWPFLLGVVASTSILLALGAGLSLFVRMLLRGEAGQLALRLLGANLSLAGLALAIT